MTRFPSFLLAGLKELNLKSVSTKISCLVDVSNHQNPFSEVPYKLIFHLVTVENIKYLKYSWMLTRKLKNNYQIVLLIWIPKSV